MVEVLPEPRKLYVLVREDLPPGLRAAQLAHAVAEITLRFPEVAWRWHEAGNYLIVLGLKDEEALWEWWGYIQRWRIARVAFREPDLGMSMTAFACLPPPELNRVFSPLPLAYAPRKRRWFRRNR
jgi:hypothetical protein